METILGTVMLFAGNFAPVGWYACEGQLLQIADESALFSLLGTTYGGDGSTTFALPDLRGRLPNHQGQGRNLARYTQGQVAGAESVSLTAANCAPHTHAAQAVVNVACNNTDSEDSDSPVGAYPRKTTGTTTYSNTMNAKMGASTFTTNLGPGGNSQPIPMAMPTLAMTYCISNSGVYPSQP